MPKPKTLGSQALDLLLESFPDASCPEREVISKVDMEVVMQTGRSRPKKGEWAKKRDALLFKTEETDELRPLLDKFWFLVNQLAVRLKANPDKVGTGLISAYRHHVRPWATGPKKRLPGSPAKTRREKRIQLELPF